MKKRSAAATVLTVILAVLYALFGRNERTQNQDRGGAGSGGSRVPAVSTPVGTPAAQSQGIRVSAKRRRHILDGDRSGGGHGPGRGTPGKSEFPGWMTDDDVIEHVERIANDPNAYPGRTIPVGRDRYEADGTATGPRSELLRIRVVVEPRGEGVVTAYPTNVRRNP